jgi:6-pyruvoyltetrahydropterin 2'-reductase
MSIKNDKQYMYSEIFHSIQGEGQYTGHPTAWLRFFLCNLQCNGFGQKDPTDPSTYELPYQDINPDDYNSMEELPVFEFGCDSSYSWSKKFKGLQRKGNVEEIASEVRKFMKNKYNPDGKFNFNTTNQHMCFTGGEPLMKHAQEASVGILKTFIEQGDEPLSVTYETNGTQDLTQDYVDFFKYWQDDRLNELFFSISPKLWSVAGEKADKAIKPEVVKTYYDLSQEGQLKFVINGTKEAWDELDDIVANFSAVGVNYPVWVMPVGATVEGQKLVDGDVAQEAFKRGYSVAGRVHTYLWGNVIGV